MSSIDTITIDGVSYSIAGSGGSGSSDWTLATDDLSNYITSNTQNTGDTAINISKNIRVDLIRQSSDSTVRAPDSSAGIVLLDCHSIFLFNKTIKFYVNSYGGTVTFYIGTFMSEDVSIEFTRTGEVSGVYVGTTEATQLTSATLTYSMLDDYNYMIYYQD